MDIEKAEIARGLRREAQILLNKAKELESKAASLFQSAAILDGHDVQIPLPLEAPPVPAVKPKAPKGTRRTQVRGLLLISGALTRNEIRAQTGIPKGTLDHLLNEKNGFRPRPDGAWELIPERPNETVEDVLGI